VLARKNGVTYGRGIMNWQKLTSVLQIVGAALGIPAAAGGTYSVYRNYFAPTANCPALRSSLLETMDRSIPVETKRTLMRKELAEFSAKCGAADPDAIAVFTVALKGDAVTTAVAAAKPEALKVAESEPAKLEPAKASDPARPFESIPAGNFGRSAAGETRGWVALDRRDAEHLGQSSFDGFEVGKPLAEKSLIAARWAVPVWYEPQPPGPPDIGHVQGRTARGQCLRVLAYRTTEQGRPWANVEPAPCAVRAQN
jgi:hypothetical protein